MIEPQARTFIAAGVRWGTIECIRSLVDKLIGSTLGGVEPRYSSYVGPNFCRVATVLSSCHVGSPRDKSVGIYSRVNTHQGEMGVNTLTGGRVQGVMRYTHHWSKRADARRPKPLYL